jgi:uncharacterized protein
MTTFIETYMGQRFEPLAPDANTILVEDIAHALSQQNRFSGHTELPYSVAEHAVRVSWRVKELGGTKEEQFWGLNHDDSEAYLVDLPTPIKKHWLLGFFYRWAERRLMKAICRKFRMVPEQPAIVHQADADLLATEVRDLMPGLPEHWSSLGRPLREHIGPWSARRAEREFLMQFRMLEGER